MFSYRKTKTALLLLAILPAGACKSDAQMASQDSPQGSTAERANGKQVKPRSTDAKDNPDKGTETNTDLDSADRPGETPQPGKTSTANPAPSPTPSPTPQSQYQSGGGKNMNCDIFDARCRSQLSEACRPCVESLMEPLRNEGYSSFALRQVALDDSDYSSGQCTVNPLTPQGEHIRIWYTPCSCSCLDFPKAPKLPGFGGYYHH